MIKIAFLVLHYKNLEETKNCIDSIFSITNNKLYKWEIVIVDNGSNNGSGEELQESYINYSNIKVIISENNLGFSMGNNLGYKYIREELQADYVVVTNNDVIFYQNDFIERINDIYNKTNFFVLGPDIYVRKNKEHQSPITINKVNISDIEKELEMYRYYLDRPKLYVKRRKIQILKNRICSNNKILAKIYNRILKKTNIDRLKAYENVVVQGACIIISKDYLNKEEKMFSPEPFLYCEELFLYFKCIKNNYKIVYDPSIRIFHEDSASIKAISKNLLDKAKFTLPHHVKAREILLKYLKNEM
ncbi:glycosyltransferase family 2 protein [uncultured Clostridium sp.]|uniref:glycosyltransferase family 2 protein n=1 Tax=uncultured Clostridium sp. TaxID=59620 RepID=UPI002673CBEE|nr:glycosyltransferase [uncultured Clostridium sp.]